MAVMMAISEHVLLWQNVSFVETAPCLQNNKCCEQHTILSGSLNTVSEPSNQNILTESLFLYQAYFHVLKLVQ